MKEPGEAQDAEQEARLRRELSQLKQRWIESRGEDVNYVKEAFFNQYNLITLAGLGALTLMSLVTMPPLTPLLGSLLVGWEVSWLGIAPSSERFRRATRARKNAAALEAQDKKRTSAVDALPPELRGPYEAAAKVAREIRAAAETAKDDGEGELLEETLAKLDHLLEQYAQMLLGAQRLGTLLRSPEAGTLDRRVTALEAEVKGMEPGRLRDAKEKNLAVLQQRAERFRRSREEKEWLDVSLETLENTLKLVRDQVVAATSASGIASSLDTVLIEVSRHKEHMDRVERELHNPTAAHAEPKTAPQAVGGPVDLDKSDTGVVRIAPKDVLPAIDVPTADGRTDEDREKEKWQRALEG